MQNRPALIVLLICAALAPGQSSGGSAGRTMAAALPHEESANQNLGKSGPVEHVQKLTGDYGLRPFKYRGQPGRGRIGIDARDATFVVANSGTPNPDDMADCRTGNEPVNRYPFSLEGAPRAVVVGGLFRGRVPQDSDWKPTYCNSAALNVKNSNGVTIEAVRVNGVWDAVRVTKGSPNLALTGSWLSDVRDDAVENDYLQPLIIEDTLIDGAFQGLSMKPYRGSPVTPRVGGVVKISGLLLRLREYRYQRAPRFGALIKSDDLAPRVRMENSIVAIDYDGGTSWRSYWERTWRLLEGRNNLLLWMSTSPMPESFVLPPSNSGFLILKGEAAAELWSRAMKNWINCHPAVGRLLSDQRATASKCIPDFWGSGVTVSSQAAHRSEDGILKIIKLRCIRAGAIRFCDRTGNASGLTRAHGTTPQV